MKILITDYIERNFIASSAPSKLTIIRMIKSGRLDGEKFGGRWYVNVKTSGDEVVDDILKRRGLA